MKLPYEEYADNSLRRFDEDAETRVVVYYCGEKVAREENILSVEKEDLRNMIEDAFLAGMTHARKIVYGEVE